MDFNELEAAVLNLDPEARARLAGILLSSLDGLSEAENARLWIEEAQRREADLKENPSNARPSSDVLMDARSRLP